MIGLWRTGLRETERDILDDSTRMTWPMRRAHLIGVGGSGMQPLAAVLASMGWNVTGSDADSTLKECKLPGVRKLVVGHCAGNISSGLDLVVHSPAVGHDNPELV